MAYSDPEYVARQYRDASNLETRIALHVRFSTNPYGLARWILDHFELQGGASLLEVGCGPGRLWTENLDLLPKNWAITLSDASPGMVAEAEARLEPDGRFEFRVADVRDLPFEEGRFDAVVANHMLYHVPDRELGILGDHPRSRTRRHPVRRDERRAHAGRDGLDAADSRPISSH